MDQNTVMNYMLLQTTEQYAQEYYDARGVCGDLPVLRAHFRIDIRELAGGCGPSRHDVRVNSGIFSISQLSANISEAQRL